MSLTIRRVKCLNVFHNLHLPAKENGPSLRREFSQFIAADRNRVLVNTALHRVPCRNSSKHQVEVFKRIQWKRPEKVPSILPVKSGDMSGLQKVDLDKPLPLFEQSPEYQSASDLVKRVFSLRFQPRTELKQSQISAFTEKVRRHKYDNNSVEVKIAKYTAIIRNMQVHCSNRPYDRVAKADLKEIIDFRKKRMKLLRSLDYKRFEWLLEQLDLLYKPAPTSHERVERKKSIRWLAAEYIENVKQKKLEEYQEILESQKKDFLERKLSAMKTINEEEQEFGLEPSFSTDDIVEVEKKLHEILAEEAKRSAGKEVVHEVY